MGNSVRKICKFAGISVSYWYKSKQDPSPKKTRKQRSLSLHDSDIIKILKDYRKTKFFENEGGYRKLSAYLRRDFGKVVNHKKVYRLAKIAGILLKKSRPKFYKSKLKAAKRIISAPNQLWQFDVKYCFIHEENRFCYLCVFIDVFSRKIVNYHLGLNCKATDIERTLKEALRRENIVEQHSLYIRSDNGPQMSSKSFSEALSTLPVSHEFIPCQSPNDNAYVESFHSQIEVSCLSTQKFENYGSCYEAIVSYIEFYNTRRIHGKLKMSPKDFECYFQSNPKECLKKYEISA